MRWLLVLASCLLGGVAWLLFAPSRPSAAALPPLRHAARPPMPLARRAPPPPAPVPLVVPSASRTTLTGEALRRRVDEQLPTRLYAEAARCYRGGLPPDQRLDLSYRLRVSDGELTVTEARVESSTLGDRALERCIVDRVLGLRDRDEQMPDWEGDDELFIRVGGFKPYLAAVGPDGDDPR